MGVVKKALTVLHMLGLVFGVILSLLGAIAYLSSDTCKQDYGIWQLALSACSTLLGIQMLLFFNDPDTFYRKTKLGNANIIICSIFLGGAITVHYTAAQDLFINPSTCLPNPSHNMYIASQVMAALFLAMSLLIFMPYLIYRIGRTIKAKHRERKLRNFYREVDDLYSYMYSEEEKPIKTFFKKYKDLAETEDLTNKEKVILVDYFKTKAEGNLICCNCEKVIEEDDYFVRHPECDHSYHKECISFISYPACRFCGESTRLSMLKHIRKELLDTSMKLGTK